MSDNKQIVQQYWDALAVRDWDAMKALLEQFCQLGVSRRAA